MRIDHVQVAAPPGCEEAARAFYGGVLGLAFRPARKAHPAFVVDDLDPLAARVGEVQWDDAVPGVRRFYASDPFGNRLEFFSAADPTLPSAGSQRRRS